MPDTIIWVIQMAVRDGKLEDARALMPEMVESTKQESGTMVYEWFLNEEDGICHIYERYADSAAALVHMGNFGEKFAERFMGCFEPTAMHVYGEPNAEVRAGLDEHGAVYLGNFGGFSRYQSNSG